MGHLFEELKRRNVVRVGIAYAVVGWILAQIAELVLPTFGAPDWVLQTFMFFLILGLPVALFFSWAYEVTPQGVKKTAEVDADASITPSTGRKLDRVIIAALVIALGYFVWERQQGEAPGLAEAQQTPARATSIAVLPFADMSPDGNQAYFADGIAEELLNGLVKVKGLRVAGRTSSFQFRGQNLDLPKIGQQLRVEAILEGSVRTAGTRVRITAQLINAADGFHLWSETYDREMTDIFAVQDEISTAIVEALMGHLTEQQPAPAPTKSVNIEAYNLYLRGRHLMAQRSVENIQRAAQLFAEAVVLDENFAEAHAALAKANGLLLTWDFSPSNYAEYAAEAKKSAGRALALDPLNAEAQIFLGRVAVLYDWDWAAAERNYLRAIELNPNDAEVANFVGDFFFNVGDLDRSLEWEQRAIDLDPLHAVNYLDIGQVLNYRGEDEEALAAFETAWAIDPSIFEFASNLFQHYQRLGRFDDMERIAALAPGTRNFNPLLEARFNFNMARFRGQREAALEHLKTLEAFARRGEYNAGRMAVRYLQMDLLGPAALWFEEAYKSRDAALIDWEELMLPEDLPDHPAIKAALDKPELNALYEIRRRNLGRAAKP